MTSLSPSTVIERFASADVQKIASFYISELMAMAEARQKPVFFIFNNEDKTSFYIDAAGEVSTI